MGSFRTKSVKRLSFRDRCCVANTGCSWDGTLRNVVAEPIYVQKVYDAALFHLQTLKNVAGQIFSPAISPDAQITEVLDIRCKKYFNPGNVGDDCNLRVKPVASISGAQFVEDNCGNPIQVIGPDGTPSQKIIFGDTEYCDAYDRGTPIYGTQNIEITGCIEIEMDVEYTMTGYEGGTMSVCSSPYSCGNNSSNNNSDNCCCNCCCDCGDTEGVRTVTLRAVVPIADCDNPLILTNFFELCIPSVYDTAFLPRFAEFCNIGCEARLVSNNIARDIRVNNQTGQVSANLLIAILVSCEKKIIVPVQLCVLSTGFPVLNAETFPIAESFPKLFPKQIDEYSLGLNGNNGCGCKAVGGETEENCGQSGSRSAENPISDFNC